MGGNYSFQMADTHEDKLYGGLAQMGRTSPDCKRRSALVRPLGLQRKAERRTSYPSAGTIGETIDMRRFCLCFPLCRIDVEMNNYAVANVRLVTAGPSSRWLLLTFRWRFSHGYVLLAMMADAMLKAPPRSASVLGVGVLVALLRRGRHQDGDSGDLPSLLFKKRLHVRAPDSFRTTAVTH